MRPSNGPTRVSELSGFIDLGMAKKALELAREILSGPQLTAEEFSMALSAILIQGGKLDPWKTLVVDAYRKLPKLAQRSLNSEMLSFFSSTKDYVAAEAFVCLNPRNPLEAFMTMPVLLARDRLNEAKALSKKMDKMLKMKHSMPEVHMLLDAMADYSARVGDWATAAHCWSHMLIEDPLGQNGIRGLVELSVVQAIAYVDEGLRKVADYRKNSKREQEIILPGNERKWLRELEGKLLSYRKHLTKLVPLERQREFGMSE